MENKEYCNDCALRLFNTKGYKIKGIGNPEAGRLIVLPTTDYNAYKHSSLNFSRQVEIIKTIISSTGVLQSLYILPLLRCNTTVSCEPNDYIYSRCMTYLGEDVRKYNFCDIMLLGDAVNKFFHIPIKDNLQNMFISRNGRRYCVNYSPLIKHINENLYKVFEDTLYTWYVNTQIKYYNNYNIIQMM